MYINLFKMIFLLMYVFIIFGLAASGRRRWLFGEVQTYFHL